MLYGEGQVVFITPEGEIASWKGFGVGRPTGPSPAARYAVCGSFFTTAKGLVRLHTVATVLEYELDQNGAYRWTMWEWK